MKELQLEEAFTSNGFKLQLWRESEPITSNSLHHSVDHFYLVILSPKGKALKAFDSKVMAANYLHQLVDDISSTGSLSLLTSDIRRYKYMSAQLSALGMEVL